MNSAAFRHLLRHFHTNKHSGALDCLYWQALGNDLTNFAKRIRRTLEKAKLHHGFEGV